jgi:hypothetical protein
MDLFFEQAEGYVKALEKSTSRILNCREVFEYSTKSEPESRFGGSVVLDLKIGQADLVSGDDEAAVRPDQKGCKGGILPVFTPPRGASHCDRVSKLDCIAPLNFWTVY